MLKITLFFNLRLHRAGRLITVSEQEEQSSDQLQGWRTNGADELGQVKTALMEPLTEKQLAMVRTAVDVFGMDVVKIYCWLWCLEHTVTACLFLPSISPPPSLLFLSSHLIFFFCYLLFSLLLSPPPPPPPPLPPILSFLYLSFTSFFFPLSLSSLLSPALPFPSSLLSFSSFPPALSLFSFSYCPLPISFAYCPLPTPLSPLPLIPPLPMLPPFPSPLFFLLPPHPPCCTLRWSRSLPSSFQCGREAYWECRACSLLSLMRLSERREQRE